MSSRPACWEAGRKWPRLRRRLPQLWLAVRVGLWLCVLPIRWRLHSFPDLLQRFTRHWGLQRQPCPVVIEQVVPVVRRVCRLRCFRTRLFPQACLRQALTLYYVVSRWGSPVALHIGIRRQGDGLRGHSWVTVDGRPLGESRGLKDWTVVYTYPENPQESRRATSQ